jgi:hypothetical protein
MKQFSSSPGELDDISTNKSEIRIDVKGDESSNLLGEMVKRVAIQASTPCGSIRQADHQDFHLGFALSLP